MIPVWFQLPNTHHIYHDWRVGEVRAWIDECKKATRFSVCLLL